MSNDTCPYCGCGKYNDEIYWCNTLIADPSKSYEHRSVFCRKIFGLKEQSEQQAAEIERLKQAVLDEREACARTASEHACYGHNGHRIAKEIRARGEEK